VARRRRGRWRRGAQQAASKLPIIGFFSPNRAAVQTEWTSAFVQRLGELGWIEGRTVAIEYRWAEGRTERLAEIAAELVRQRHRTRHLLNQSSCKRCC
jgi:putative ABC transport system substrate-binding protein